MADETLTGSELEQLEAELDVELEELDEELNEESVDESDLYGVMDQISDLYESSGMSIFDFSAAFGASMNRSGYVDGRVAEAEEAAV